MLPLILILFCDHTINYYYYCFYVFILVPGNFFLSYVVYEVLLTLLIFISLHQAIVDILPRVFHVGQLVSCIVLQLDNDNKEKGKRKIWLSLCLSLLHKGFTLDSVQEGMVISSQICYKSFFPVFCTAISIPWFLPVFHFF